MVPGRFPVGQQFPFLIKQWRGVIFIAVATIIACDGGKIPLVMNASAFEDNLREKNRFTTKKRIGEREG